MDDASPRFRQDLEASATEAEGVACVDVRDPRSGTSFRFYDFEYQLALQFNGQPLTDVVAWASQAYGVDLTVDGINEFAGRLSDLGFLEKGAAAPAATPAATKPPPDGLDNAEAEWMSAEGAKTATFVPEPGMLDAPSELTPVVPELPTMDVDVSGDAEPAGAADADAHAHVHVDEGPTPGPASLKPADAGATPPPRLFDIPSTRAHEAPTAPVLPAVKAPEAAPAKPAFNWAMDLEGTLQSQGEPRGGAPQAPTPAASPSNGPARPGAADEMTPPPLPPRPASAVPAPRSATPSPAGLPERRQPPTPDAVQMTAFSPDAGAAKPKSIAGRVIAVIILLIAIAGVVYVAISRENARVPPAAMRVRVLSPRPTAVYRWFPGRGTVTDHEARTLAFPSGGVMTDLLPPGTGFAAGDILGRLRGAAPIEALLSRHRARLAFYQQMRESMQAANNRPELRQAEIRFAEKQRLVDETTANLAKLVVRAGEPGEVVETLAKVGTFVRTNAPVVRVKGRMLHGEFELDAEQIAAAGKLGFCRVEVVGLGPRASNATRAAAGTVADLGSPEAQAVPRFIDCTIEPSGAATRKLRVALPDNLGLVPGQPLRLARQRFDAVFPVPAGAVAGDDGHRTLWVASAAGTAERRDVVVADLGDDALVSDGLRVGDEVILDARADLQPGAPLIVER